MHFKYDTWKTYAFPPHEIKNCGSDYPCERVTPLPLRPSTVRSIPFFSIVPVTRSKLRQNLVTADFSIPDAIYALRYASDNRVEFHSQRGLHTITNALTTACVNELGGGSNVVESFHSTLGPEPSILYENPIVVTGPTSMFPVYNPTLTDGWARTFVTQRIMLAVHGGM